MEPDEAVQDGVRIPGGLPGSSLGWGAMLGLGVITLILGVILAFRPAQTLTVIAVLLGIVMIVCGIYHIVRALDGREHERVWRGIAGVLFILVGIVLLRHLHLSIALIGLFVGFTWVMQGILTLMEVFSGDRERARTGWSVFFGVISLIAGIVVISVPIASVATLTVLLGIWFIVMGALEIVGSFVIRRAIRTADRRAAEAEAVNVPQQRDSMAARGQGASMRGTPGQDTPGQAIGQDDVPGQATGLVTGQDITGQGPAGESRPSSRDFPR